MKKSKNHIFRNVMFVTATLLITLGVIAGSRAATDTPREQSKNLINSNANAVLDYGINIPDLSKIQPDAADQITSTIIEQRKRKMSLLVWELGNKKLSNHAKVKIINLLGAFRSKAAVEILIKNIDFVDETRYLATAIAPTLKTARTALVEIGLPASNTILMIVSSKNKNLPFDKSQVEGFAEVLYYVEEPRYSLMKLKDKMAATKDADIKVQCQMMIDGLKKFTAHKQQLANEPN